jgi:hypothetical protein
MAAIHRIKTSSGAIRYRAQIRRKGYPTMSKNFPTKAAAREWARGVELDIATAAAKFKPDVEKHTFSELIGRYIEDAQPSKDQIRHIRWWDKHLGHKLLHDLKLSDFKEARRILQKEPKQLGGVRVQTLKQPRTPATVNRYCTAASVVLNYGTGKNDGPDGWLDRNPMRSLGKLKESKCQDVRLNLQLHRRKRSMV